jgi:enoyl-CoA hydratase/carnithine racemase
MAPFGIMAFMIRAIGHRAFRRYGLSGERIAAADALRLGLVHEICDSATLDATLTRIADDLLLARRMRQARSRPPPRAMRRPISTKSAHMCSRRTIQGRRRRTKASRASARSASRAGIRSKPFRHSGAPRSGEPGIHNPPSMRRDHHRATCRIL